MLKGMSIAVVLISPCLTESRVWGHKLNLSYVYLQNEECAIDTERD